MADKKTILLVDSLVSIREFNGFFKNKKVLCAFFIKDGVKLRKIEEKLDARFELMDIGRNLNNIICEIRNVHAGWVDSMSDRYGKSVDWWMGNISSRNIFSSNLLLYSGYLVLIKRLIESDKVPDIFMLENRALLRTVRYILEEKGYECAVPIKSKFKDSHFYFYLKAVYNLLVFTFDTLKRLAAAKFTKHMEKPLEKSAKTVLLDLFILNNSFNESGEYKDKHYYPGLYEWLGEKGFNLLILPTISVTTGYLGLFKAVRLSKYRFIIKEDYLTVSDYIYAIMHPFRFIKLRVKSDKFLGIDMTSLVKEDSLRYLSNPLSLRSILKYRLFKRLKESGIKPSLIIDWFENQVFDKALNIGAKEAYPDTPVIGAHNYISYLNLVHLFPTVAERKYRVIPDKILVSGSKNADLLRVFDQSCPLGFGPSLRYADIFNNNDEAGGSTSREEKKLPLVCLPIGEDDSVNVLDMVVRSLRNFEKEQKVMVKFHPGCNIQAVMKKLDHKVLEETVRILDVSLEEALKMSSLVISAGSGTCIEAAARGIPVAIIGSRSSITNNPMEYIDERIWKMCFTSDELVEAIKYFHKTENSDTRLMREIGEKIKKDYFEPITEKSFHSFVKIDMRNNHWN